MDLFCTLWKAFSLEERSIQELIDISSYIDNEKRTNGLLVGKEDDLSVIASVIVALINEKSTFSVGEMLNEQINNLIVSKNFASVVSNDGKKLYEKLKKKESPGTYKVKKMRSGYKFDLVAGNGQVLATSEIYSTKISCINGIEAVKKNSWALVEDQTIEKYESIKNPKYEIYCDRMGEFRFRLKSMNGQILVVSGGFKDKKECFVTIERIKASGESNDIEKN